MKHKIIAVYSHLQALMASFVTYPEQVILTPVAFSNTRFLINPIMEKDVCLYFHINVLELAFIESDKSTNFEFTINKHGGHSFGQNEDISLDLFPTLLERYIDLLLEHFGIKKQFDCPITVRELEPFPENTDPHLSDESSMYTYIAKPWCVLHKGGSYPDTIILANGVTGRRFELDLSKVNVPLIKGDEK